jgi:hypothetical protein
MAENDKQQNMQVVTMPRPTGNSPLIAGRVPAITNIRTAKRLLSRLIAAFCRGEIVGQDAKTLAYLLATYCQITKDSEIETRLEALEAKLNDKKH